MALVMKRKLVCAAAQEDDDGDSDNEMVVKPPSKKQKDVAKPPDKAEAVERTKANDSVTQAPSESRKPKKEKEFAWMDSDEEQGEDEKKDEPEKPVDSPKKTEKTEDASGSEDENADVSAATLDSVQTFGRMMVLSPALLKKIPRMLPEDVAAACRALARTKFFDGDINRVLYGVLKRLLLRDRLTVEQADDVLKCFASLNVYDESVFSAIARQMKVRTASIDQALRTQWYDIYKGFNHSGDKDFYQLLEVPHLTAISPAYKRLRCFHNQNGNCAVGDACTYSHDPRAPIELESSFVRPVSKVMMTQTQSNMGRDVYGGPRNGQMNT
mmetsp:Transcript_40624/g.88016  ORF Transcript_40624/g.88016 Transcript_40624/m.88016 type:complete len:327 (-) Transcript_40624:29-1009(-)